MRITGSCGIRLVVSPLAPACLMFAAVCLDASPRHLIISCLAACRSPLRASARASPCFVLVIDVGAAAVPLLLAFRPASSTRRAGRYDGAAAVLSALPACSLRLAISSVRLALDGDVARALAPLDYLCLPVLVPWSSSVPPANRSLAQSDFLAVLSSCRPIISSPSLPDHSTRGTGRGLLVLAACLSARSLLLLGLSCGRFVRVLWRMASEVALLAWVSYYVCCRWGTG